LVQILAVWAVPAKVYAKINYKEHLVKTIMFWRLTAVAEKPDATFSGFLPLFM